MRTTGWPPGLLQDDDRGLSRWLASRPDARYQLRKNMTTQTEVLLIADQIEGGWTRELGHKTAAELRRLHEENKALLSVLSDVAYGLESARIWGGMDWTYNPLHQYKYLPLRDKARAAIAKATGESK